MATPGRCSEPRPRAPDTTGTGSLCGEHFTSSLSPAEIAGPAATAAQQRLIDVLAGDTTTVIGIPATTRQFLSDLAVIARHALRRGHPTDRYNRRVTAPEAAEALSVSLDILAATSLSDAADRLDRLLPGPAMRSGATRAALPHSWHSASEQLQQAVLKARDHHLRPADRLRSRPPAHGRGPPPPTTKPPTAATLSSLSSSGPAGHCGFAPTRDSTPRSTGQHWPSASCCRATPLASNKPANASNPRTGTRISAILRRLGTGYHTDSVLAVLLSLAEHLDRYGSPIDYQRRRQLFVTSTDDLITGKDWRQLVTRPVLSPATATISTPVDT